MCNMKVTADTSILIHLAAIGRFYLLKELFGEIIIPESVYNEVVVEGDIKDIDNLISSGYRIRDDIIQELKATLRRWSR